MSDRLPVATRYVRPGQLPPESRIRGPLAILDVAFDGDSPHRDVEWARQLGDRLAVWVDHHDQPIWSQLKEEKKFVLVPRRVAPACPPLITRDLVDSFGPVQEILAHGDMDGVLSAAKWMLLQEGCRAPEWVDPDGIVADTRRGNMTSRGARLDAALRAAGRDDSIRDAIVLSVVAEARGADEPYGVRRRLDEGARQHERMLQTTESIMESAVVVEDVEESVCLVELRALPRSSRLDVTHLMVTLQARHDFVIVLGRQAGGRTKIVVGTDPERTGMDIRHEFGLQGFAPFRGHMPAWKLLERLPSQRLREELRRHDPKISL